MLKRFSFELSYGYLSKLILRENNGDEIDKEILSQILSQFSSINSDIIECYYGCLPDISGEGEVFDYLILYKDSFGFKPIVIKNGICYGSGLNEQLFIKYYEPFKIDENNENEEYRWSKEYQHRKFGYASYETDELLELIHESSREKFHEFLKEKYDLQRVVLLF
jgi:hypothetical protein